MYDPVHLRSFLAVAQTLSFTRAAGRLELRQSTVSQHVRRLEAAAGRPLFLRDTHSVQLTPDGEAMAGFAREILDVHDRAERHFRTTDAVRGTLRLGVSEDLISTHLPEVLQVFRRRNPLVDVELTVALSGTLHQLLDGRDLDLVFAKRLAGQTRGQLMWRDQVAWLGATDPSASWGGAGDALPLVVYPPPSITRAQALAALSRAGRPWRIACTSGSLGGLVAAARAGLGLLPHSAQLIPPGLSVVTSAQLPPLGEVEFILLSRPDADPTLVDALGEAVLAAGHRRVPVTAGRPA
ncbi:LysR substrate-binding domain-containing protein [Solwaraspora sp. WMMD406]|uniref:LysR substrate-binding domain-containing protein n=1 Tax=Solwaraspora sp. WMMD406 TaxID=3016095 RepID=UPI002416A498|nr:LysR substrate-binding domain-containing protein [Solwaraspora sp. WMMD406]MDG4763560.1 LysR substrate-binding domain-containing protein [Solwaraspora sp. WMMD406]